MSATEVPDIVQVVFNMELLAIPSMSEVGSEHKVCFVAFLRHTKVFLTAKKSPGKQNGHCSLLGWVAQPLLFACMQLRALMCLFLAYIVLLLIFLSPLIELLFTFPVHVVHRGQCVASTLMT